MCGPAVTLASPRGGTRSSSARAPCAATSRSRFADGQLTLATVAHEFAHALAGIDHGHDAVFRAAFVDVVAVLAGAGAAVAARRLVRARWASTPGVRRGRRPIWASGDGFVVTSA